ncbi:hypothetical protein ACSW9O_15270 (plasmid) [Clostridium perfringens]|nr:hypothetical protein [Clostridium perfringens]
MGLREVKNSRHVFILYINKELIVVKLSVVIYIMKMIKKNFLRGILYIFGIVFIALLIAMIFHFTYDVLPNII